MSKVCKEHSLSYEYECPRCSRERPMESLEYWQHVEEQIARNKQPRFNWKAVLGMSLTRKIARYKAAGMTVEQTIKAINEDVPGLTEEAQRRLKIGVCARFGEMGTAQSELRKVPDRKVLKD